MSTRCETCGTRLKAETNPRSTMPCMAVAHGLVSNVEAYQTELAKRLNR